MFFCMQLIILERGSNKYGYPQKNINLTSFNLYLFYLLETKQDPNKFDNSKSQLFRKDLLFNLHFPTKKNNPIKLIKKYVNLNVMNSGQRPCIKRFPAFTLCHSHLVVQSPRPILHTTYESFQICNRYNLIYIPESYTLPIKSTFKM